MLAGAGAIVALAAMPPEQLDDVLLRVKRHTPEVVRDAWRNRSHADTTEAKAVVTPEQPGSPVRNGAFVLECRGDAQPISPLIYGTGGTEAPWELGVAARRWGGNPTSRYNW